MIYNVTLVRLLSTYILVTYHARAILLALGLGDAELDSMRAGTDLFIVCSAFLTTHVNARRQISAREFLRKRIVRIVPLYWVMTLSVFALALLFPTLFSSTKSDFSELFMSLFFVPYLKDSNLVQPIVFVAWTLNLIMLFSIVYALSIAVAGLKQAWLAAMIIVAALVLCGQLFHLPSVPLEFYTDLLLVEFLFGLAISHVCRTLLSVDLSGRGRTIDLTLCLSVAGLALAAIIAKPYLWPDLHRAIAYGLPCAALLSVAIRLEAHGFAARSPILQKASNYSYAIYLSHFFATVFFCLILQKFTSGTPLVALALLLATLVTATIVGMLLHHFVEKPLVALFERSSLSFRERLEATIVRPVRAAAERAHAGALTKRP